MPRRGQAPIEPIGSPLIGRITQLLGMPLKRISSTQEKSVQQFRHLVAGPQMVFDLGAFHD